MPPPRHNPKSRQTADASSSTRTLLKFFQVLELEADPHAQAVVDLFSEQLNLAEEKVRHKEHLAKVERLIARAEEGKKECTEKEEAQAHEKRLVLSGGGGLGGTKDASPKKDAKKEKKQRKRAAKKLEKSGMEFAGVEDMFAALDAQARLAWINDSKDLESALNMLDEQIDDPDTFSIHTGGPIRNAAHYRILHNYCCLEARRTREALAALDHEEQDLSKRTAEVHEKLSEVAKKKFRSLAIRLHPDKLNRVPTDEEYNLLLEIQTAYQVLTDPELRRQYIQMNNHSMFLAALPKLTKEKEQENKLIHLRKKGNRTAAQGGRKRLTGGAPHRCTIPHIRETQVTDSRTGAMQLTLQWTCSGAEEMQVDRYDFEMILKKGGADEWLDSFYLHTNVYTTHPLGPGHYSFRVRAHNNITCGEWSKWADYYVEDLAVARHDRREQAERSREARRMRFIALIREQAENVVERPGNIPIRERLAKLQGLIEHLQRNRCDDAVSEVEAMATLLRTKIVKSEEQNQWRSKLAEFSKAVLKTGGDGKVARNIDGFHDEPKMEDLQEEDGPRASPNGKQHSAASSVAVTNDDALSTPALSDFEAFILALPANYPLNTENALPPAIKNQVVQAIKALVRSRPTLTIHIDHLEPESDRAVTVRNLDVYARIIAIGNAAKSMAWYLGGQAKAADFMDGVVEKLTADIDVMEKARVKKAHELQQTRLQREQVQKQAEDAQRKREKVAAFAMNDRKEQPQPSQVAKTVPNPESKQSPPQAARTRETPANAVSSLRTKASPRNVKLGVRTEKIAYAGDAPTDIPIGNGSSASPVPNRKRQIWSISRVHAHASKPKDATVVLDGAANTREVANSKPPVKANTPVGGGTPAEQGSAEKIEAGHKRAAPAAEQNFLSPQVLPRVLPISAALSNGPSTPTKQNAPPATTPVGHGSDAHELKRAESFPEWNQDIFTTPPLTPSPLLPKSAINQHGVVVAPSDSDSQSSSCISHNSPAAPVPQSGSEVSSMYRPREAMEAFLRSLNLGHSYVDLFRNHDVTMDDFPWLTESDLTSMGVTKIGPLRRLLVAVQEAQQKVCGKAALELADGWSIRDWLKSLALDEHTQAFEDQEITLDDVPMLTDEDVTNAVGIRKVGQRRRILRAVQALRDRVESKAVPTANGEASIQTVFGTIKRDEALNDRKTDGAKKAGPVTSMPQSHPYTLQNPQQQSQPFNGSFGISQGMLQPPGIRPPNWSYPALAQRWVVPPSPSPLSNGHQERIFQPQQLVQSKLAAAAPPSYCCSLTREVMRNPIRGPDGYMYELEHIQAYLRGTRNWRSPITGATFLPGDWERALSVPDVILRNAINGWLRIQANAAFSSFEPVHAPPATTPAGFRTTRAPTSIENVWAPPSTGVTVSTALKPEGMWAPLQAPLQASGGTGGVTPTVPRNVWAASGAGERSAPVKHGDQHSGAAPSSGVAAYGTIGRGNGNGGSLVAAGAEEASPALTPWNKRGNGSTGW
ncbi:WD repeat, SAM and U-box domain-containing protein 1 [Borealophlyctis nickersoniae]|nr:WD repeat, SAM and U-box domain-containing protein 1 [Borealophlyctis nickersoniae]